MAVGLDAWQSGQGPADQSSFTKYDRAFACKWSNRKDTQELKG